MCYQVSQDDRGRWLVIDKRTHRPIPLPMHDEEQARDLARALADAAQVRQIDAIRENQNCDQNYPTR